MRLIDLPRTSSFRLALVFLALFGVASFAQFGLLYVRTQSFLIKHIDDWLNRELSGAAKTSPQEIARRFDARVSATPAGDSAFTLYDRDGTRVAGTALPLPAELTREDVPFDFRLRRDGHLVRYRGLAHRLTDGLQVLIAQNLSETQEFNEDFVATVILGMVLTIGLGMAGAVIVSLRTMQRFDAVALTIQRIVRGDLARRLAVQGTSGDLDRLARVVNDMLDEIERLMQDVKGVCDGIAHDLRTPLTRMLAGLERARRRAGTPEAYAETIDDAIVETQGVLKTFSALLRIAEVEDGARRAGFTDLDLAVVASDVFEFYEPLAEEAGIELGFRTDGATAFTKSGDASLMFEAIGNLVDNAIKFTPRGGRVQIVVSCEGERVGVTVQDSGSGISDAERSAVFRRFYRAEGSRHLPGNGLGLSLVAAVTRLHDMELTIENTAQGCRFQLY